MPTSPNSIIEHRKPITKEYLSRVSVIKSKVYFSKYENDILIEVIAYHPADSSIPLSTMNQKQSM